MNEINITVSGPPGCGKTLAIKEIVDRLTMLGHCVEVQYENTTMKANHPPLGLCFIGTERKNFIIKEVQTP